MPDATAMTPLLDAVRTLWPAASEVRLTSGQQVAEAGDGLGFQDPAEATEFLVVPNSRSPLMLLPADSSRAAASAALRWGATASTWQRVGLSLALRMRAQDLLLRDRLLVRGGVGATAAGLAGFLSDVLGRRVLIAVRTGSLRANRKPVLQVLDPGGTVLAFAKVGNNALTRQLVRAEAASLIRVLDSGLASVLAPVPLYQGNWEGLELLVLSPLPLRVLGRRRPRALPVAPMREVSQVAAEQAPLAEAPFWARIRRAADGLADESDRAGLASVIDSITTEHGAVELALGAWHGDWTSWNMEIAHGRVLVWDWERFALGVPVGFDPLHFRMSELRIRLRTPVASATRALHDWAPQALAEFGLGDEQARLVSRLYLVELTTRYLQDGQRPGGNGVRAHGRALLTQLADALGTRR